MTVGQTRIVERGESQGCRGGEAEGGGSDANGSLVPRGRSEILVDVVNPLFMALAGSLPPGHLRTLTNGLKSMTTGRTRTVAFSICFTIGVGLSGATMLVAASMGFSIGPPMSCAVMLFGAYLFAVLTTGGRLWRRWLATPEELQIRAVAAASAEQYRKLREYAAQMEVNIGDRADVEARLVSLRRELLAEQLRALAAIRPDDVAGPSGAGDRDAPKARGPVANGTPGASRQKQRSVHLRAERG